MSDCEAIRREMGSLPIFSTHEHHKRDEEYVGKMSLEVILQNSYAAWSGVQFGPDAASRAKYLDEVRHYGGFLWLDKALPELYGMDGPLTPGNWDELSSRIGNAHREKEHHVRLLREKCRYERFVQDSYWDPGDDIGHEGFALPTFRVNMFLYGYHPDAKDHNGNNPLARLKARPKDLGEYVEWMESVIRGQVEKGAVALKSALAYDRPLDFDDAALDAAAEAYGKRSEEVSPRQQKAFGDYVFNRICEIAARLGVPFQNHLGMGLIGGSRPMLFEPVLRRHPKTFFVLFHGGYPWVSETAGLAAAYDNVALDLCWLPILSPTVAPRALNEFLDCSRRASRITWGGDCWTSEEDYGAVLGLRQTLAAALDERLRHGLIARREVEPLCRKICFENARAIYSPRRAGKPDAPAASPRA